MGDGANDIPMILEAGFGIAYRAKPKTEANADACVRFGGLERIRGWLRKLFECLSVRPSEQSGNRFSDGLMFYKGDKTVASASTSRMEA